MNDCPTCRRTECECPYRPPYVNENFFLQLDLRAKYLTRTIADFKRLLATKGKANAA